MAAAVSGCGNGGPSGPPDPPTGQVQVRFDWSERPSSGAGGSYLPRYAFSLSLVLHPADAPEPRWELAIDRPEGASVQTVTFEDPIPVGAYVLEAHAHVQASGQGEAVAAGKMPVEVEADQETTVELALASTLARLEIPGQPVEVWVGQRLKLTGRALDEAGQERLLPAGVLSWSLAAGAELATLSPQGVLTGRSEGEVRVRLSEPGAGLSVEAGVRVRLATNGLADSPWPKLLGGARNSGRGLGAGATGRVKWEYTLGSVGFSPALGPDGTLYVKSQNALTALDKASGLLKWEIATGESESAYAKNSTPAIGRNGTVYVAVSPNKVVALDGTSGQFQWEFVWNEYDTYRRSMGGPNIGPDGTVYATGVYTRPGEAFPSGGLVFALDGATGEKKWQQRLGSLVSPPVVGPDGTVYVGATAWSSHLENGLFALEGASGAIRWSAGTISQAHHVSVGNEGIVFIGAGGGYPGNTGSSEGRFYAFDATTREKLWDIATPDQDPVSSSALIGSDNMIYLTADTHLLAVDGSTGVTKWQVQLEHSLTQAVLDAQDTVYTCGDVLKSKMLYAVDGKTGVAKWKLAGVGTNSSPALDADGTLYLCTMDGKLYAVG
jgi:outer membrane protein assembly factor BamB